uniref:Global nitrogen transcriptional regulator n=1 Tax=Kapraunia schneideri TaxID=717899 RepID=A0A1Z1MT48_9FLOR|nr:global nitrogen transcriptional regulator [Kapraunia schneideri]ARW69002.1 global nitrogen transcriptional regulator [Kapraunia schneideri]
MNWIFFLRKYKIPYQVYKLNQGDSILLNNKIKKGNNITIILTGVVGLTKIFCNGEFLPIAILSKNNIIHESKTEKIYYEIIAIKATYIIKVRENNLYKQKIRNRYRTTITRCYYKTFQKYEETINILSQTSKRNRILLFVLFIFLRFGIIKQHNIIIPFKLNRQYISIMTTTKIETVNKIIKKKEIAEKGKLNFINIKKLKLV